MEPLAGCNTCRTSTRERDKRVNVVLRCPDIHLSVGSSMVKRVSLGQRVMIKTLRQYPELNGQPGTVVEVAEKTCTEDENVRVAVRYTSSAGSSVPTPTMGVIMVEQVSTAVKQINVEPRNLAVVMKEEAGGTTRCYGTNRTPLGETAVECERCAQSTTDSRRHLAV